ncbi:hypothetical protein BCR33DRAFT_769824 [Rhizoclosmatium globosum]|uniref:Uncharacterized protein n=1 Tax=Rhizoclosmatium globosum TaxID=329046 RepID=A0A1Y2BRX5_9FUNG|nr:hypothetical protein BCR33DRAFT_769824 [Rhizoclosmatium globosum]|eukprot:ORY37473.1 hypothetical protein BCR33DRAFT_769824 [Rhizoclosmatium globosum]
MTDTTTAQTSAPAPAPTQTLNAAQRRRQKKAAALAGAAAQAATSANGAGDEAGSNPDSLDVAAAADAAQTPLVAVASSISNSNSNSTSTSAANAANAAADAALAAASHCRGVAETVAKRLRNLQRRLAKLETYEALPVKDLEKDQIEAIARKGEVAATIKELEEVAKALTLAEAEEVKDTKEKLRLAKMTEDLKVATSVMEAQNVARENLRKSMELSFALSTLLPNISVINVRLTDAQYGALSDLRALVLGSFPINDSKSFFESADHVVSQYLSASASEFSRGVTYAELNTLIQSIVSPPPVPKFGLLASVVENGAVGSVGQQQQQQGLGARSSTPTTGRAISFFAE